MNFINWEFSVEVQPELNRFLHVVSQNKYPECNLHNRIIEIFPELKDIQQNLDESKSFVEQSNTLADEPNQVIVVDDGDEQMEVETEHELPNISLLSLTQPTTKVSEECVLDPEVNVFIEYLLECLENGNLILEQEYVTKFVTFNNYTLNYLFDKLLEMSDDGVYNLNKSICKHTDKFPEIIPQLFCKIILFSKLKSLNPSKKIMLTLKEFYEVFSNIIRQELIVVVLIPDFGDNNFYQIIINSLNDIEKQNFLSDFVHVANDLELRQLSMLESLISSKSEDQVKRRLINLLKVSVDKFKNENLFVKLVITLINSLESGFEDQEDVIYNIIEKCKTANKITAQKALKKWVNKFNCA